MSEFNINRIPEEHKHDSSSEQPKEYIITEEQLHNLVHGNAQLCLVMEKEVRSRPHPAPETKQAYRNGFDEGFEIGKAQCETHHQEMRAATDRKAREDVLKEVRPEVWQFALLMEAKLRKNDHKEHWSKCNQEYLLMRLDEEVKELHSCFFIYSPGDMNFLMDGQHEDRIPGEAADVANFAMMLWDNFGEKESPRTTTPHPAPSQGMTTDELWDYSNDLAEVAARKAREDVAELLDGVRKYANGEYKEADLSDNEREMRIHLEYENRIWGIMRSLRTTTPQSEQEEQPR